MDIVVDLSTKEPVSERNTDRDGLETDYEKDQETAVQREVFLESTIGGIC